MTLVVKPASEASASEIKGLIQALRKTCLFQHASEASLFRLAMEMERVQFSPGDTLGPREGEPQSALFVVTAGRLARRTQGRLVYENVEDATPDLIDEYEADETTSDGASSSSSSSSSTASSSKSRRTRLERRSREQEVVVCATAAADGRNKSAIDIMCPDKPGLVAKVASALRAQGLSIDSSSIKTTRQKRKTKKDTSGPVEMISRFLTSFSTDEEDSQNEDDVTLHTAYQVHEVVDAKTHEPVTDAARMRRIEAALVRTLDEPRPNLGPDDVEADGSGKGATLTRAVTMIGSGPATHLNGGYNAFGTLHVFGELPAMATTTAVTSGVCWRLPSKRLAHVMTNPTNTHNDDQLALDIASGLAAEVFRLSNSYSTPLFEQPAQKVNVAAVSVAAAVESYYRSALNSFLNAAIQSTMAKDAAGNAAAAAAKESGITLAKMFPEMHIQIPTRVLYINGFKLSRQWLAGLAEEPVAAATARGDERTRSLIMLIPALAPGVLMTPISSVLEACNAGYSNPEPLYRRWMRGVVPRCAREVIFGLGLNNMTDWAEERIPRDMCEGKVMRNALGSMAAGVVSGYFSHVPHNLSTMKLLQPDVSYKVHVGSLINAAKERVPASLPPAARDAAAGFLALVVPKGLGIRTTQVVGSFVLLNGITHVLSK